MALGPIDRWSNHSQDHGTSGVWRGETRDGVVWLKVQHQARKYAQECEAARVLWPWLAERGHRVPRAIAVDPASWALLMTEVPGVAVADLPAARLADVFRQAGRFLADLHRAPIPSEDATPLGAAIRQRARSACQRARGVVADGVVDRIQDALVPAAFDGVERVYCHRDFWPRNWLLGPDGIGVIDFEHSRPDHWLSDLLRLEEGAFHRWPALRTHFLDGYGRQLSADEEQQLARLAALHALSTTVWAREHGDLDAEALGRVALELALDRMGSSPNNGDRKVVGRIPPGAG